MPHSLVKIYVHAIFATKKREKSILPAYQKEMFAYIGGTLNNLDCPAVVVGGTENHIHALFCMSRNITMSDLMRKVKATSSHWYKDKTGMNFAWQEGYASFSVSQSSVDTVIKYIENQEEHHRVRTFEEEYEAFLRKYNINFDDGMLFD